MDKPRKLVLCVKASANKKHCCGTKNASRTHLMFLENFKSIFCFQDTDFELSTYVACGSKLEQTGGIIWETLTLNVFRMFPRCIRKQGLRTHTTNIVTM